MGGIVAAAAFGMVSPKDGNSMYTTYFSLWYGDERKTEIGEEMGMKD